MLATLGRTFSLIKQSWHVLQQDRELIALPLLSAAFVAVATAAFAGIAAITGSLDRALDTIEGVPDASLRPLDIALAVALQLVSYSIVMFFNAALISAAMERLRGGDPTVGSGIRTARHHIPAILGWAFIAVFVGLLLGLLESRFEAVGRFVIRIIGAAWGVATFFVIPVLIVQNTGPIEAIKQSSGLLRRTWGNQIAASFGFGLVYIAAIAAALIPGLLIAMVAPILGIIVAVPLMAIAFGVVAALEGIFKAALYDFATGATPHGFETNDLRAAYRAL